MPTRVIRTQLLAMRIKFPLPKRYFIDLNMERRSLLDRQYTCQRP